MNGTIRKMFDDAKNRWKMMMNSDLKKAGLTWLKARSLKYDSSDNIKTYQFKNDTVYYRNAPELLYGLKEIFIEDTYKIEFDSQQPYILDCGANIGLSVLYLKRLYPFASITAFEPDEKNFELLQKNIKGMTSVEGFKKAVWKENTILKFESSSTLSARIATDASPAGSVTETEATRLKDYLNKPVDLLKLDIEGAEYTVIKDCGNSISMAKNIFIEYHGRFEQQNELNEIFALLQANGFYYYVKEAADIYPTPFYKANSHKGEYDVQLNIFCFKKL